MIQGSKFEYIGETSCLVKEQINIHRQHRRQPSYQQLAVEEHLPTCGDGRFHMFPHMSPKLFKKVNHLENLTKIIS